MRVISQPISLNKHQLKHLKHGTDWHDAATLTQSIQSKTCTIQGVLGTETGLVLLCGLPYTIQILWVNTQVKGTSTPTAEFTLKYGASPFVEDGDILANITATSTRQIFSSFDNMTVPAGDDVWIDMQSISGSPSIFTVTVYYQITAIALTTPPRMLTPQVNGSIAIVGSPHVTNIPSNIILLSCFGSIGIGNLVSSVSAVQISTGIFTSFGNDSGGAYVWNNPTNLQLNDGLFASVTLPILGASVSTGLHAISPTGLNIPLSATIVGIELFVNKLSNATDMNDNYVYIVKNGVTSTTVNRGDTTDPWNSSFTWSIYGSTSDLWGLTWTPADFNSQFGFAISAINNSNTGSPVIAEIDQVYCKVYWNYDNLDRVAFGTIGIHGFVNAVIDGHITGAAP